MFLKNYTSDVPVSQTIFRIEQVLIKCGVKGITKEYDPKGEVSAVRFQIAGPVRDMDIRLPVNYEAALLALWLDYVDGDTLSKDGNTINAWGSRKRRTKQSFIQQANRTAWKIMQDWVEVQMSMIQMKQAEPAEVFLSYVYDSNSRTTIYGRLREGNFRALLPETTSEPR